MPARMRVAATLLLTACAAGSTRTGAPPAAEPAPAPATPRPAVTPPPPPAPTVIRIGPQAGRYIAHQRVEIRNDFAGMPPEQVLGFRSWFSVTVRDTSDSSGRLATVFVIDSVTADSATVLPPTINLATARGLTVRGWVATSGELEDAVYSDSVVAQNLGRLLGWFRRFFPHVPPAGLRSDGQWTDSLTSVDPGLGATISRTAVLHTRTAGWEMRDTVTVLRIDATEAYEFSGSGDGGGQPIELRGTGTRTGVDYLTGTGIYLGGTSSDTASMTIVLPQQGITIPQRQIGTLTITWLPR